MGGPERRKPGEGEIEGTMSVEEQLPIPDNAAQRLGDQERFQGTAEPDRPIPPEAELRGIHAAENNSDHTERIADATEASLALEREEAAKNDQDRIERAREDIEVSGSVEGN